jgi:hypothetical protein
MGSNCFSMHNHSLYKLPDCGQKLGAKSWIIGRRGAPLGIHDEIKMVWNVISRFSEYLPKQALYAIANHSFTHPSGNRHSQPGMTQTIPAAVEHESLSVHLLTRAIDGPVIRGTNNPVVPGEPLLGFSNHSRSAFFDLWPGGVSKPACPPWSPSSNEIRGSSSACCCWAERFSSSLSPTVDKNP